MRVLALIVALAGCSTLHARRYPELVNTRAHVAPMLVDGVLFASGSIVGLEAKSDPVHDNSRETRMHIGFGVALGLIAITFLLRPGRK